MDKRVGNLLGKIRKNQRGFTLVELMIVVVIIGILAAVVVPRIRMNADTARENANRANVKMLQSAVERYHFDTGQWPDEHMSNLVSDNGVANWRGPYVDEIPDAPQGGGYLCNDNGKVSAENVSGTNTSNDDDSSGQNRNGQTE